MEIALSIIVGVEALALVGLALRMNGIKSDLMDARADAMAADAARENAERMIKEFGDGVQESEFRHKRQLSVMRKELEDLDEELSRRIYPGTIRDRLMRIMSQATPDPSDEN